MANDIKEAKSIKFPEKALVKAQQLLQQKAIAEMQFESYVHGVFDALNLDGEWNLDVNTWVICEKPKEAKECH